MSINGSKGASLLPALGLFTTTTLVVGGVIGSGIFRNPSTMAGILHSPWLLLGVWVVAGIVTMFGALTNAEVSGIIPATGGQYQYFRRMYGEFIAFLYGWALFVVIQTGSIASITFIFAEYFNQLFPLWQLEPADSKALAISLPFATIYPLENIGIKLLTFGAVAALTLINCLGVKEGGRIQLLFTVAKVGAILFLGVAAFTIGNGSLENITQSSSVAVPTGTALILAVVMAMNKALWSYDGWNNVTYVAGEIKQPHRNIPRALMMGTAVCIAVYVVINLAYLYVMPIDTLSASSNVAADAARIIMGPTGFTFVVLAVIISTIGTSNGTILVSSRVYYSMAYENMFFRRVGNVHPRFRTPVTALLFQLAWTTVLIFSGTFDMLTDMLIFVSWVFYALGAYGVFILRKKMPDAPRPYKTWGYPAVPIIFILFAAAFLVFSVVSDITNYQNGTAPVINCLYGAILLAAGIPFYFWFRRAGRSA